MKKLSEYKGEEGIRVIGELLLPIASAIKKAGKKHADENALEYVSRMLTESPSDFLKIERVLCEIPEGEQFEPNAAESTLNFISLMNDPDLIQVFTLQVQTLTSSASA